MNTTSRILGRAAALAAVAVLALAGTAAADTPSSGADVRIAQTLGARDLTVVLRRVAAVPGPLGIEVITHAGSPAGHLDVALRPTGPADSPLPAAVVSGVELGPTPGTYGTTVAVDRPGAWELALADGTHTALIPFVVPVQVVSPAETAVYAGFVAAGALLVVTVVVATRSRRPGWILLPAGGLVAALAVAVTGAVLSASLPLPPQAGTQVDPTTAAVTNPYATVQPATADYSRPAVLMTLGTSPGALDLGLLDAATGLPVDDLVVHDEAFVHLLVVGPDGELWHLHPVRTAPGRYSVPFTAPVPGHYALSAELERRGGGVQVVRAAGFEGDGVGAGARLAGAGAAAAGAAGGGAAAGGGSAAAGGGAAAVGAAAVGAAAVGAAAGAGTAAGSGAAAGGAATAGAEAAAGGGAVAGAGGGIAASAPGTATGPDAPGTATAPLTLHPGVDARAGTYSATVSGTQAGTPLTLTLDTGATDLQPWLGMLGHLIVAGPLPVGGAVGGAVGGGIGAAVQTAPVWAHAHSMGAMPTTTSAPAGAGGMAGMPGMGGMPVGSPTGSGSGSSGHSGAGSGGAGSSSSGSGSSGSASAGQSGAGQSGAGQSGAGQSGAGQSGAGPGGAGPGGAGPGAAAGGMVGMAPVNGDSTPDETVAAYGPLVPFTFTFPLPGRYRVWFQVEEGWAVRTVAAELDVTAPASAP